MCIRDRDKGVTTLSAEITYIAQQTTAIDEAGSESIQRLVDILEENEDVSDVFTNAESPEATN